MNFASISYGFPYFIFFIFFLILFYFENICIVSTCKNITKSYYNSVRIFVIFSLFTIFFVFIGFRGFVNTDWINYYRVFDNPDDAHFEYGFKLLMLLTKKITNDYTAFVVINAIIDFFLFYNAFKNQKNFFLCFLFYYIFSGGGAGFRLEFNLMRNIKSILIFCISIKYIKQNNFLKYALINIIGCLFHITAIIYIPLYFVLKNKISYKKLIIFFIMGNIIFLLRIRWLIPLLIKISDFIPGSLGKLIQIYLNSSVYNTTFGISIGYLERFFSFILIIKFYKQCDDKQTVYYNIWFFYAFIYLFCSEFNIMLSRLSLLFIVGYWYVYPDIYNKITNKNKKLFMLVFIMYSFLRLVMTYNNIIVKYDNILLKHLSFEKRTEYLNKFTEEAYK